MKVSVLMPTYNHQDFIGESIKSFLMQECDFEIELIICDDASTDNTAIVAQGFAMANSDKIKFIQQPTNKGLLNNYKRILFEAKGQYLAILESDDVWLDPLKLQKQVDYLDVNPDCGLCYTFSKVIDKDSITTGCWSNQYSQNNYYSKLLTQDVIVAPTTCFRSDAFFKLCNIDQYIELGFKTFDYPTWLAIAKHYKIHCIEEFSTAYRLINTSISNTASFEKRLAFAISVCQIVDFSVSNFGKGELNDKQIDNIKTMHQVIAALSCNQHKEYKKLAKKIHPTSLKTSIIRFFPNFFAFIRKYR